jgi:hypothetical protein
MEHAPVATFLIQAHEVRPVPMSRAGEPLWLCASVVIKPASEVRPARMSRAGAVLRFCVSAVYPNQVRKVQTANPYPARPQRR